MRAFGTFLAAMVALVILLAMAVIVSQNGQTVQLTVLNMTISGAAGLGVAIAAGLGFLAAFLLLIPGRLASAWRGLALSRRSRALEANLGALREEHAQLRGSHERLLAEHRLVMGHMLGASYVADQEGQAAAGMPAALRGTVVVAERDALPLALPAADRPYKRSRRQPALVARVRVWVAVQRERLDDAWFRLRLRLRRPKRDPRGGNRGRGAASSAS